MNKTDVVNEILPETLGNWEWDNALPSSIFHTLSWDFEFPLGHFIWLYPKGAKLFGLLFPITLEGLKYCEKNNGGLLQEIIPDARERIESFWRVEVNP